MASMLVLASSSPRRAKILADAGVAFEVVKTDAEEVSFPADPERTVRTNAAAKLAAVSDRYPDRPVLAADTIVWYGDEIYGKPRDFDEAAVFLRTLSGKTHTVFTGLAFRRPGGVVETRVERSDVTFRELSDELITDYIARVKPLDRAGAYDIDESGDLLVEGYTGSYENIMGLPPAPVLAWLSK